MEAGPSSIKMDEQSEAITPLQPGGSIETQIQTDNTNSPNPTSANQTNDPLSILEEALDTLLKILRSTYDYITNKASHKQAHPDLPIWIAGQAKESGSQAAKLKAGLVDDEVMKASIDEFVRDLIYNCKAAELTIKNLPDGLVDGDRDGGEEKHEQELRELEAEMRVANEEYKEALKEAKELHSQVSSLLREVTSHQQSLRSKLASGSMANGAVSSKPPKGKSYLEEKSVSNKRLKES